MRKLLVVAMALAVVVVMKAPSFAFTSVNSQTVTASAAITGTGTVSMSVAFNSGTSLTWSGITAGTTKWKATDNFLVLHSTMTSSVGGIQIYTNNTATGASPKYTGTISSYTASPAGLVCVGQTIVALPMCWRVSTIVSTTSLTIVQYSTSTTAAAANITHLGASELGSRAGIAQGVDYPCFLWMLDKSMNWPGGFTNSADYATVRDALRGIQHAESTWATGVASPTYLYFGADFTNAMTPATYTTNELTIEAFTE